MFVSYSREDSAYVARLARHLTASGLTVWYDRRLEAGQQWRAVIESKIDSCAVCVVVWSAAAKNSVWVDREIIRAQQGSRPILPVRLDATHLPVTLNDLHAPSVPGPRLPDDAFVATVYRLAVNSGVRPVGIAAADSAGVRVMQAQTLSPSVNRKAASRWIWIRNVLLLAVLSVGIATLIMAWSKIVQSDKGQTAIGPSSWVCGPASSRGASLRVDPNGAEVGATVVFSGDGFPANAAIDIDLYDRRPDRFGKIYDVGTARSDACGKFDYLWDVPSSLPEDGHRSVGVAAASTAPSPDPAGACCHAATTLEIVASF